MATYKDTLEMQKFYEKKGVKDKPKLYRGIYPEEKITRIKKNPQFVNKTEQIRRIKKEPEIAKVQKVKKVKNEEIKYQNLEPKKFDREIGGVYKFIVEASPEVKKLRYLPEKKDKNGKPMKRRGKDSYTAEDREIIQKDIARVKGILWNHYGIEPKYMKLGKGGLNFIVDTNMKDNKDRCLQIKASGFKGIKLIIDKNYK